MDIYKYTNPNNPNKMEGAVFIENIESKLWVEKYRDAGEFTFTSSVESGIKDTLPIGSFISHTGSKEIMIVENHEITSDENGSIITITGRSFETFFENRVVGYESFPYVPGVPLEEIVYTYSANKTYDQAVSLLDDYKNVQYVTAITSYMTEGVSVERDFKTGPLYDTLIELLKIDNLGIRTIKPGIYSPLGINAPDVVIYIYKGQDRSSNIQIFYEMDDLVNSEYLWSNKSLKNEIIIVGKWVKVKVTFGESNFNKRILMVDGSEIDTMYDHAPGGSDLTKVIDKMTKKGNYIITSLGSKKTALLKTNLNSDLSKFKYGTDYDLGDIILVHGDYNESAKMRIVEHVEFEDSTSAGSYPILISEDT